MEGERLFENNRVCKLLGIQYPVLEGGMAWAGTAALAAAVSNAGGLGTIGAAAMQPGELRESVKKAKQLTDRPFAVNLVLINPDVDRQLAVLYEEGVSTIIFGAGNPAKHLKKVKERGIKALGVVSSTNLAIFLERAGIDAIIGEGLEAGGHIGTATTLTLTPSLTKALDVPVIAAGGIADAGTMKAVFSLGAEGIQMGTRFLCSHEAEIHPHYKELIVKKGLRDSTITGDDLGHPVRVIKSRFIKKMKKLEREDPEKAEKIMLGSLSKAVNEGNPDNASFMAGLSMDNINEILSVETIIQNTIKGFERSMNEGHQ